MNRISTGSKEFDKFMKGGYEKDIITTFYGPAGSGKSNFCMMVAVEQAKNGKKVIYIDTEGGFSVERIKQLTEFNVMENIILLKPTSFEEQKKAFNKLLKEIRTNKIGLIIVDSIIMLYRLELGIAREKDKEDVKENITKVNKDMALQLRTLAEIARKKEIPIIVTNQVYSSFEEPGKVHMAGGDLLKYWSKCIVELQDEGNGKKKAILKKHRSLSEGKEFSFIIINKGLKERKVFRIFN